MTYPKLTPEQWAQIPPEFKWVATDQSGIDYAYVNKPEIGDTRWNVVSGKYIPIRFSGYCGDWFDSLQKRPTMSQTEIKEIGTAVLSDILIHEGFNPESAPTPAVTHVRLSMPDFERIAKDFGLNVRNCETYCDAAMYNPAGQIAIVFVADVPVNVTVHDEVNGIPVTVHDQI